MRVLKVPVLALLSAAAFLALWALEYMGGAGRDRIQAPLISFVMALLYGWPALFGLARSVGAGPFGRCPVCAAIVLSPVAVTLALKSCGLLLPDAAWPNALMGIWQVGVIVTMPLVWFFARSRFAEAQRIA